MQQQEDEDDEEVAAALFGLAAAAEALPPHPAAAAAAAHHAEAQAELKPLLSPRKRPRKPNKTLAMYAEYTGGRCRQCTRCCWLHAVRCRRRQGGAQPTLGHHVQPGILPTSLWAGSAACARVAALQMMSQTLGEREMPACSGGQ